MSNYVIVWNGSKTEGVIFRNNMGDSGEDDARHAADVTYANPCATIADSFRECYGEEDDCTIQEITIDTSSAVDAEEF